MPRYFARFRRPCWMTSPVGKGVMESLKQINLKETMSNFSVSSVSADRSKSKWWHQSWALCIHGDGIYTVKINHGVDHILIVIFHLERTPSGRLTILSIMITKKIVIAFLFNQSSLSLFLMTLLFISITNIFLKENVTIPQEISLCNDSILKQKHRKNRPWLFVKVQILQNTWRLYFSTILAHSRFSSNLVPKK